MTNSPNISLVRRLYEAQGDITVIEDVMDKNVHYDISIGFPYGGIYDGLDSVLKDFFGSLYQHFETFGVDSSSVEYIEIGDRVIALGYYAGKAKNGKLVRARLTHVWTIKDGKLSALWQTSDNAQFVKAIGSIENEKLR